MWLLLLLLLLNLKIFVRLGMVGTGSDAFHRGFLGQQREIRVLHEGVEDGLTDLIQA